MNYTDEFYNGSEERAEVNMPSVIALGYGPISAKRLAELVRSGEVHAFVKDNETYFRRNPLHAR